MSKFSAWVQACRLRTLPLSLSGIILGSFIAKSHGYWDWKIFILALITTVLFQIVSNLANDLGDGMKGTDNAQRVGPERAIQSGKISEKEMKTAVILTAILSFLSALALIYFGTKEMEPKIIYFYIGLALLCILAAISYTVGKKAYGYHGLGDLMVFIFFGIVSVMGVYPLFAKKMDWLLMYPAESIGLLSVAVLNLNNMRDYKNDAKSGKRTMVVKMGPNFAKMYHCVVILLALVCMAYFISKTGNEKAFIGLIPGIYLLYHIRLVMQTTDPKNFDPELKKVALCTFGIAVLTSMGLFL